MKVLISGSSKGIGRACSEYFLSKGHHVIGIDIVPSDLKNDNYSHYIADVSKIEFTTLATLLSFISFSTYSFS